MNNKMKACFRFYAEG